MATLLSLNFFVLIQSNAISIENQYFNHETIQMRVNMSGVDLEYLLNDEFEKSISSSSVPIFTSHTNEQGSAIYKFYEEGITNLLEVTSTGDLFLDGSPVTIQSFDENKNLIDDSIVNVYEIVPFAHRTKRFEYLPSGITDDDLSTHLGTTSHSVSIGEQAWRDVGVGTITAILTSSAVGLWSYVAGGTAQAIVSVARNSVPYSNYFSYEKSERKGMYVGGYIMIVKTYYKYYGTRDFTAPLGSTTYYTGYSD